MDARFWLAVSLAGVLGACGGSSLPEDSERVTQAVSAVSVHPSGPDLAIWENVLNQVPTTISYKPSADYDADNCELFVNGIGNGEAIPGNGFTADWLEVYLSVPSQNGQLLNVGMYTQTRDTDTVVAEHITFGQKIAPNYWETGFTYFRNFQHVDLKILSSAFFIDVKRPNGKVVRLWQSNHGPNYTISQTFALPPSGVVNLGGGSIRYASNDSYIFYQKRACQ